MYVLLLKIKNKRRNKKKDKQEKRKKITEIPSVGYELK